MLGGAVSLFRTASITAAIVLGDGVAAAIRGGVSGCSIRGQREQVTAA